MTSSQAIFGGLGNNAMDTSGPSDNKPPKTAPTPPPTATPVESKIQSAPVSTPNAEKR